MTTTATTNFAPSTGNMVLNAFSRNQIFGAKITTEHLVQAEIEANLIQVKYANLQPNLYLSNLTPLSLTQGIATYTLPATVVDILIIYMTTTQGGVSTDRVLGPLSTVEYAALPNKTVQGAPTSYFWNRLINPTLTIWPVPDGTATYTLNYRFWRQAYDASARSGYTPDMPYRWLDAYSWELTARMAAHYAPANFDRWQGMADKAWRDAAGEDSENVNIYLTPGLGSYYK
ncbi:MAG TPA: hypothetical protein VI358_18030 [Pseudolabrys sp.]